MKFQVILFVGVIIELCFVPFIDAKRSFGITRSRSRNNKLSVRRNQHHEYDDNPMPKVPPKPTAPQISKPAGPPAAPVGPPPAYSGMGHNAAPSYGAPPAYSPSYSSPPGYSNTFNQPRYNQMPNTFTQPGYSGMPLGGMPMSSGVPMSGMPMGVMPMNSMPMGGGYGPSRSSGFGSGIMTNLFAGLAGYQLAKAFSGGGYHHRDRDVVIIDNRQPLNTNPVQTTNGDEISPINTQAQEPSQQTNMNPYSTERPTETVTQVVPATNEYNFYGIPQYGIPLYGYSLPSQITDYYQTAIFNPSQTAADTTDNKQSMSGK